MGALALGDGPDARHSSARSPGKTGPLLLLGGAGIGQDRGARAARRAARRARASGPSGSLVVASTRATAQRLQRRVESLLDGPYEELWIGTWECDRPSASCASTPRPPGSTPSSTSSAAPSGWRCCSTASTSCRCASQEIRGNPAGLLARLLERIDELKAGADPAEPELAELCAAHDRILAEAGAIDRGDLFLILNRLLDERPDVRDAIAVPLPAR